MVTLKAPAKINLTLEVLRKRPDGYHEIAGVLQTLSLCDTLYLETAEETTFQCNNPVWSADKSLVIRVIQLLKNITGITINVTVKIKKELPLLSGLGGDSSDAAALLRGLNELWKLGLSPEKLRELSVGLGISFELAEEMKKKYGDVTPQDETNLPKDIALTGDGHSISYQDLSDIIRVRIEEMLRLIILELPQQDYQKLIPAGLVITGGGANLPGIAELGESVTRMPVRLGRPFSLPGVSDALDNPAYATGVGLLLWQMKNQGSSATAPAAKDSGLHRLLTRMFKLFH